MNKPLGRDRLGRLIYSMDTLIDPSNGNMATAIGPKMGGNFIHVVFAPVGVLCRSEWTGQRVEVLLVASPKHTNHERYFGDMDRCSVIDAAKEICDDTSSCRPHDCVRGCPFDDWYKFNVSSGGLCLAAFVDWLDMEATV